MNHQDWETYIIHCKNETKGRDTDKKRKDKEWHINDKYQVEQQYLIEY